VASLMWSYALGLGAARDCCHRQQLAEPRKWPDFSADWPGCKLRLRRLGWSSSISLSFKEHVQNILRKLAVKDRTQAAVWAVRKGLV
jgi:hypothetical protein